MSERIFNSIKAVLKEADPKIEKDRLERATEKLTDAIRMNIASECAFVLSMLLDLIDELEEVGIDISDKLRDKIADKLNEYNKIVYDFFSKYPIDPDVIEYKGEIKMVPRGE